MGLFSSTTLTRRMKPESVSRIKQIPQEVQLAIIDMLQVAAVEYDTEVIDQLSKASGTHETLGAVKSCGMGIGVRHLARTVGAIWLER